MAETESPETRESAEAQEAAPKKKGKFKKLIVIAGGVTLLAGGGAGAGFYVAGSGLLASTPDIATAAETPALVPKAEEKRATLDSKGGEHGDEAASSGHSRTTPAGTGGDKYASNYYAMDKEFTSNLLDSVHFVQIGVAVSTPYDDRVLENLKTHEIAVRSAILMTLGDTSEDQVFTVEGKRHLQTRLRDSINGILKKKEGFGGIGNVYFTNFVVQ